MENFDAISARMDAHEAAVAALQGKTSALGYAVIMLIAAHPNRDELRATWPALSADLVDVEMRKKVYADPGFRAAFQSALASVAEALRLPDA